MKKFIGKNYTRLDMLKLLEVFSCFKEERNNLTKAIHKLYNDVGITPFYLQKEYYSISFLSKKCEIKRDFLKEMLVDLKINRSSSRGY